MRYWLVMPAAGSGRRFGERTPKQYVELHGRTVIQWSLEPFLADSRCAGIVLALAAGDEHWKRLSKPASTAGERRAGRDSRLDKVTTVAGGAERAQSVEQGLRALADRAQQEDWVLVHDAARPCLEADDLERLLAACHGHAVGGLLATPVPDTLKRALPDGSVERTVERAGLWRALTPQMFRYRALCTALGAAVESGRLPTDESQAIEWAGGQPLLVAGSASNIKITSAEDLTIARALLAARANSGAAQSEEPP